MTNVMFFFDNEDFTSPKNADAVLALANMLTEEGVVGHFATVGLVAKRFREEGRQDVIEALKRHRIGTHSYSHSVHPTLLDMSDREDFQAVMADITEREEKGFEELRKTFGDIDIKFAVPPGCCFPYSAQYYYSQRGISVYCGSTINQPGKHLIDYCDVTQVPYDIELEALYMCPNPKTEDDVLDYVSSMFNHVCFYHHPHMSFKTEYWDALNYNGGNLVNFGEWNDAPNRPLGQTLDFWAKFRSIIRRMKQDKRFNIITVDDLIAMRDRHKAPAITLAAVPGLLAELEQNFAPLKSAPYCVADVFYAFAELLQGKTPAAPGHVRGFLHVPYGISEAVKVPAENIRLAAQKIVAGNFIPESFQVGECKIGPADMLFAMGNVLAYPQQATVTLKPRPQQLNLDELPELRDTCLKGVWMNPPEFKDEFVCDRNRLQNWTWRDYGF